MGEAVVQILRMSRDGDYNDALKRLRKAMDREDTVHVDVSETEGVYPNIATPLAAAIEHFRSQGLKVRISQPSDFVSIVSFRNPLEATPRNLQEHPLVNTLWCYFDEEQASYLAGYIVENIAREVECESGVLEALEWGLFESLDNVCQHANIGLGFCMVQLHRNSRRLAVAISDAGIGVQRSLSQSAKYRYASAFDAITMAVQEGVTRDERTNQGNGLFGLMRIIEQNGGRLRIRSGRGLLESAGGTISGNNSQPIIGPDNHGTTIDFQLDVGKPVSLAEVLNYDPVDLRLEELESEQGSHVLRIEEYASGTGTRKAAAELRNYIRNILNRGAPALVLDFSGVNVVSSSFADEVIGKLAIEFGVLDFMRRFQLVNMNATVHAIVNVAVTKRLSAS